MAYHIQTITDSTLWEAFISDHAPVALFQSWLWGDMQKDLKHEIWRWGIYENDMLLGIAQIVKVSAKRGTFLHVRHGPILDMQNTYLWEYFKKMITELAQKEHAWFVRLSPLIADTIEHKKFFLQFGCRPAAIHAMDAELCWVLDLSPTEEILMQQMRKTTRYEIRKAQTLGVQVIESTNTEDITLFESLYQETSKRHQFVPHTGVREEFSLFAGQSKAVLLLGKFEDQILAGAIILFYQNQAIYHHGASLSTKIPASSLLQWYAIQEAKKRGKKLYNFWGIAGEESENHPWKGITLFKKGFGGYEQKYLHAHDLPVSVKYVFPRTVETVRRILKGY